MNYLVIIIKMKVLLPQAQVTLTDFGYPTWALSFICFQRLIYYLTFQYFDLDLDGYIPETRRVTNLKFTCLLQEEKRSNYIFEMLFEFISIWIPRKYQPYP